MRLLEKHHRQQLLKNGRETAKHYEQGNIDYAHCLKTRPVVKLFTPDAPATFVLSELHPNDHDLAFGLMDYGSGFPVIGCIRLSKLQAFRGTCGLPVERDRYFSADKTLGEYKIEAQACHSIKP